MGNQNDDHAVRGGMIEAEEIATMIPHRYPFLLIDRITAWELEPDKKIQALKNVTINEPFFQGHFPGHPIMPGVLIVEAMAQAAGVLVALCNPSGERVANLNYLVKLDNARFKKTVLPGDQLVLEVFEKRRMRNMGQFSCAATVDGKVVASCEIMCAGRS